MSEALTVDALVERVAMALHGALGTWPTPKEWADLSDFERDDRRALARAALAAVAREIEPRLNVIRDDLIDNRDLWDGAVHYAGCVEEIAVPLRALAEAAR